MNYSLASGFLIDSLHSGYAIDLLPAIRLFSAGSLGLGRDVPETKFAIDAVLPGWNFLVRGYARRRHVSLFNEK